MMSFPIPTLLVSASIFTVLLSIAYGRIQLLGGNGGSNGGGDDSDPSGGGELLNIPLLFSPAQGHIQLGSQGDNGGNNGADIPSSRNSGGRSGGIPVNFPFKLQESESLESSQNGGALPFSEPVQNAVSLNGNNNNAAVLSLILSSPLLRRLLLNSRLLHQAYPTLALDVDGDGLIDQLVPSGQPFLLGNDVLSALVRGNRQHLVVGPRIVGPPVKVYQHKRTLHLPTETFHYVQRSVGPAIESDVYQGVPVSNNRLHPGLFASHPRATGFLLRRKREAANAFEQGAQAAVDNVAGEVANDVEEEQQ